MINVACGFLLGVIATILITFTPSVAPVYSQAIYDCGVRVASGVTGLSVTDGEIVGHRIGICIDPGAKALWISNNFMQTRVSE